MTTVLPDPMRLPTERGCPFSPPAEYTVLQTERPWSRLRLPGGRTGWLITRYDDVRALLADRRFTPPMVQVTPNAELPLPEEELPVPDGLFSALDPPEQSRYRRLVSRYFTRKRTRELQPLIERITDEQLTGMIEAGQPGDLNAWFAQPIPARVVTGMLGIPAADQPDYQRWVLASLSLDTSLDALREAKDGLYEGLGELVRHKKSHPGDDIVSELLHGSVGESPLTHAEVVNISILLLIAGLETTANMLGLGAFALLEHPGQLARLRADESLFDSAIEELLRYLTIVQFGLTRTAREDCEVAGRRITEGEIIVASLAAANRDPAVYDDPNHLDLARDQSTAPHMAFGHGVHQCLGAQLARIEMKIAFGALLRRLPKLRLAVPADRVATGTDKVFYGVHELPVSWEH
ncbi:Pentalenic acid synthase [Streptomyces sp. RB5]|uniref:Pentalenic acid synthase n=1 Tax=Streptomyces smaragdinus TaxID=2585196 RepID=A0A7K0CDQ6_9ACTN|nr:cytochrome P450 [Streptomyces smaragdinus]MQY11608.1 Pentalenic acid synthase [Streptomyces smaragdinus]